MSKPKLTPWYPASIKPVHVGGYEYAYGLYKFTGWWDGLNFLLSDGPSKGQKVHVRLGDKWRGLAAKL